MSTRIYENTRFHASQVPPRQSAPHDRTNDAIYGLSFRSVAVEGGGGRDAASLAEGGGISRGRARPVLLTHARGIANLVPRGGAAAAISWLKLPTTRGIQDFKSARPGRTDMAKGKHPRLATSLFQQRKRHRSDARSWRNGRTRPLEVSSGGLPALGWNSTPSL
jgi:hypothetical protein